MKKSLSLLIMILLLIVSVTGCGASASTDQASSETQEVQEVQQTESTEIRFTDDSGREIVLDKAAEKVISLYSVHTENLYAMGAGETIIGVGMSDKYPEEVLEKTQYSYKDDPELVIAASPDVLIIRSMIDSRYPDYIKAIEDAGITVVNLYCSTYDGFDNYMTRLAMIVGKEEVAGDMVKSFHEEVDRIKALGEGIEDKKTAYFESIGSKFKTATPDSFAGTALQIVGVDNIAKDIEYDGTSTVVTYGEEALLSNSNEIDVFIAQKGAMNKTVSLDEIKERPGFSGIKAVKEDQIIIIDEKLVSGATMRYLQGLELLMESIYGVE